MDYGNMIGMGKLGKINGIET